MSEHNNQREEVFSKSVRAGKRTYFFDVKSTKANDYYLTITESKKRLGNDGTPFYEKHPHRIRILHRTVMRILMTWVNRSGI